jgi:hypothetical protein
MAMSRAPGQSSTHDAANERAAELCVEHGWSFVRLLRVNERARTATARVRSRDGADLVLKYLLLDAPATSRAGLARERSAYGEPRAPLAPRLLYGSDQYLCRSYEEGMALRFWLGALAPADASRELSAVAELVVDALATSRVVLAESTLARTAGAQARDRFKNLMTSGPAQTERGRVTAAIMSVAAGVSGKRVARTVTAIVERWQLAGARVASALSHNDLHTDNVVVTADGPRIVDYENATAPGLWWIDALYFTAACYALARDSEARTSLLERVRGVVARAEPAMAADFARLLELFCGAAATSSRFRLGRPLDRDDARSLATAARELLRTP